MRASLLPHRTTPILAMVLLSAMGPVLGAAQAGDSAPAGRLYLVAAVNVEFAVDNPGSPVMLYQVNDAGKLKQVREITSGHKSGSIITAAQDAIYVTYPSLSPTTVSVLHFSDPLLKDEIEINPRHLNTDTSILMTANASANSHSLLLPLITNDGYSPVSGRTLLSIRSSPEGDGPRIRTDAWDDYFMLRFEGFQGGEGVPSNPEIRIVGDQLVVAGVGEAVAHPAAIAPPPPELTALGKNAVPDMLASSDRYLILYLQPTIDDLNSGKTGDTTILYVFHRDSHQWMTMEPEGVGGMQLFGPWLTDNVALWNSPKKAKARKKAGLKSGPDSEKEGYIFPGTLILQNLEDNRTIRIFTGHEDSEVLFADADRLVYRVENSIYQAKIAKDVLQDTTLLVEDKDVAQIHWVFWST